MPTDEERAVELARWQGRMEANTENNSRSLDHANTNITLIFTTLTTLREDMSGLKTSVRVWATFGAIIGAGISSVLVTVVAKHL